MIPLTSYPELEEHPSLSPDGSRVAFEWKGDIYVKEIDGEGLAQVTNHSAVETWPSWSPDGRMIAFVRGGEVFVTPSIGGGERKVAESMGSTAWMPDGSALLVTSKAPAGTRSVFHVSLVTGEKRRLTYPHDRSVGDVAMAVSPDGQMLAFHRVVVQGGDLYVVPVEGGRPQRLTNDNRPKFGFRWMPDGSELVFSSAQTGWSRLWRLQPRAGESPGKAELIDEPGDDARFPSISGAAQGRPQRLAYQRYTRNFDIRRASITGPEGTPRHSLRPSVTLITSTRMDFYPSISPDGNRVAFVSDRSGVRELWICNIDGSDPARLTSFNGPDVLYPRWSPDGARLIFSALTGPNGNFESYTISSGGGNPHKLNASEVRSIAHPIFSRDGRWIYFIPGPMQGSVDVWKIPSSGGKATQITRSGAFRPEESPDGKLLYYGKRDTSGLWSIPVDGGDERKVLDSVTANNWTVASQGIYYIDFAGEPGAPKNLNFYDFRTGKVSQVGQLEPTVSTSFSGISVSADGRSLLYSDVTNVTSDLMLLDGFR